MLVSTRNNNASRANTADIDESFPQERRLRTRREFASVLNLGIKSVSSSVVVYAHRSTDHQHRLSHPHRLGIIASKRVGSAVQRNSIKRRIRECFRRLNLPTSVPPIDFVCIARKQKNSALAKDVTRCLERLAHKISIEHKISTEPLAPNQLAPNQQKETVRLVPSRNGRSNGSSRNDEAMHGR